MMNGSVYRIKYFGSKFRTSLFTLHCPQFRSALIFWGVYIGFGLTSGYLDQKELELYQNGVK